MNRATGGDDFLPRSIMYLGFIAAALIMAVQSIEFPSGSTTAAPSQRRLAASTHFALDENRPLSRQPIAAVAHTGLTDSLEMALEPLLGIHRSILFINLSDREVHLYYGEEPIASYGIAIGRSGWETPVGEFEVISMQVDPVWQHPFTGEIIDSGAENPLGSRWIGFWANGEHQIGLHGTNQEELIGQAVSHGCIRMREADVQSLYDQVTLGTAVVVRP